jgi:hypothetical protein
MKKSSQTKKHLKSEKEHKKSIALIQIAATHSQKIKKNIILLLKEQGLPGSTKNVDAILSLQCHIANTRQNRLLKSINSRVSKPLSFLPKALENCVIPKAFQTIQGRLDHLRHTAITKLAKYSFRYGAPGGTDFCVTYAEQSSDVGYTVTLDKNYDIYRGAYKGWGANIDLHKICVPRHWRTRVQKKNLAFLGGMLTLDVNPMQSPPGIELYAAVWAVQERGYSVKTVRGFIAVSDLQHFHADSVDSAIAGVMKKCRVVDRSAEVLSSMSLAVDAFIAQYGAFNIDVSLNDARKSGSCEYGIRSWCERVGIDINRGSVPMAELLAGFKQHPLTEVRAATLYAVRRRARTSSCYTK